MDQNDLRAHEANSRKQSFAKWFRTRFHMRPPDDDEPKDWWFASTVIPLMAATAGPLANVMSIASLITPWRNIITSDRLGRDGTPMQNGIHDPRWYIFINAASLVCGIAGNFFLLCNFTRAVRYIIALPASIIFWFMATSLLAGGTIGMEVYHHPGSGELYSQAYWSGVIAAVLYLFLCLILMVNMLGYFLGHYPQHFALTDYQRTLILQTTALMIWLLFGASIFHKTINTSFAEAIYFCDLTILTLGFGDVTPGDTLGRALVMPYGTIGIIILALVVGSIHRFGHQLRQDHIVRKHIERQRQSAFERTRAFEEALEDPQVLAKRRPPTPPHPTPEGSHKPGKRKKSFRKSIAAIGRAAIGTVGLPKSAKMREEKGRFDAMRAIQRETIRFRRWTNLVISILVFGIWWLVGAIVFWQVENITYFESIYFGLCSLLTIGYGDITPKTNAGRPFFIVWSLFAIPTMTILISEMSDTVIAALNKFTNILAEWAVHPESKGYKSYIANFPGIFEMIQRRHGKERIARGFPIGDEEDHQNEPTQSTRPSLSIEELAREPCPSSTQLAQQLALAIQKTMKDALEDDPKCYTYEEWVEFTNLIKFTNPQGLDEDEFGLLSWDWIGETSPMVASESEPEWVLERLCESLVRHLVGKEQGNGAGRDGDGEESTLSKERDIGLADSNGEANGD